MKESLSAYARIFPATALSPGGRLVALVAGTVRLLAASAFAGNLAEAPRTYTVESDTAAPVLFGVERLTEALRQQGFVASAHGALKVRATIAPARDRGNESYRVHEFYRRGLDDRGREESVALLQTCLQHWDQVVASTRDRLAETPLLHTETVPFSWARYRAAVAADIATAQKTNRKP